MADITVDLWQDFDFTTLNTTNLGTNDHASVGTWTISDAGTRLSTSTSGEKLSEGQFSGNDDSAGTRGLAMVAPSAGATSIVIYEFSSDKASCSYGFWYKFPADFIGSDDEHDILYVENAFGANELYVKQTDHSGRGGHLYLYTGESGYSSAISIGGSPDTWFWITAQHNTGGAGSPHRLRVYDEDGNQVGSEVTRTSHASEPSYQVSLGSAVGALQGHTGSVYFDDLVMDWTDATFPLGPPVIPYELEQEGFAFGTDDNNEASHTLDTADTNATAAVAAVKTLRVLVNGTADPDSIAYTLRAQKNGSGGYTAVPVGATTKTTPVIETADATNSGNNTASGSWAVSYPNASTGDLLIFCISWDDSTATTDVTEPAGPNGETLSEVNATPATDSGTTVRAKVWYTIATGAWTASTLTFTPSASEQWTATVVRVPAGEFDATPIGASDTEGASGTGANVQHGSFSAGGSDGSGKLCVWTATDANPQTVSAGFSQVANVDRGAVAGGFFTRDTAVTNSESFSATTVSTQTAAGWATVAFVVRAPTATNQLYVVTSANVTGGGEATTARLTAPSGKSTSDFVTGRRWDDENGSDSIDITTDDYTEVEWVLTTQSPAANGDFWDFRVYAGAVAMDTYTTTPRLTLADAVTSVPQRMTFTTQSVKRLGNF